MDHKKQILEDDCRELMILWLFRDIYSLAAANRYRYGELLCGGNCIVEATKAKGENVSLVFNRIYGELVLQCMALIEKAEWRRHTNDIRLTP